MDALKKNSNQGSLTFPEGGGGAQLHNPNSIQCYFNLIFFKCNIFFLRDLKPENLLLYDNKFDTKVSLIIFLELGFQGASCPSSSLYLTAGLTVAFKWLFFFVVVKLKISKIFL